MRYRRISPGKILTAVLVGLFIYSTIGVVAQDMPKPGETIDKSNYRNYSHLFPSEYLPAFEDGFGGLMRPVSIEVVAGKTRPMLPSFVEYSAKNGGKYRIAADRMITGGYMRGDGLPFPDLTIDDKDVAAKLMWNYSNNLWYDDMSMRSANMEQRKGNRPRVALIHRIETLFYNGRMVVPPKPLFKTPDGVYRARILCPLAPQATKGAMSVTYKYMDPMKADKAFKYDEKSRRVLRSDAKAKYGTMMGDVGMGDDWDGFVGNAQDFTYALVGERKILACFEDLLDLKTLEKQGDLGDTREIPFPRRNWEVRDAYVVDIQSTAPYPYSRKRIYLDRENLSILYSIAWDRSGKVWKVWTYVVQSVPAPGGMLYIGGQYGYVGVNLEFGSAVHVFSEYRVNSTGFTPDYFTRNALLTRGR
jgi:hypothetical protein